MWDLLLATYDQPDRRAQAEKTLRALGGRPELAGVAALAATRPLDLARLIAEARGESRRVTREQEAYRLAAELIERAKRLAAAGAARPEAPPRDPAPADGARPAPDGGAPSLRRWREQQRGRQPAGPAAELERLAADLAPALDGIELADLDRDDIRFLEREAGVRGAAVARAATAQRVAKQTGLPAPALYAYLAHRADRRARGAEPLWAGLPAASALRPDQLARLRFVAQAGEIAGYDPRLLDALLARRDAGAIAAALELAIWDAEGWLALLAEAWGDQREALPDWAVGGGRDERLRAAAARLRKRAAAVFPPKLVAGRLVAGRILTPRGRPAAGANVQALHCGFEEERPLGAPVVADTAGRYRLALDPAAVGEALRALGGLPLQLQLVVRSGAGGAELGRSALVPGAALPLTLDVALAAEAGPTEYELVARRVRAAIGEAAPASVPAARLGWLAGAAGADRGSVERYVEAHALAKARGLPAEAIDGLLHPAVARRRGADGAGAAALLAWAAGERIVGEGPHGDEQALERWWRERRAEERARLGGQAPADALSKALAAAGVSEGAIELYARLAGERPSADQDELRDRLAQRGVSGEDLLGVRLARLAGHDPAAARALREELRRQPGRPAGPAPADAADEAALPALARLDAGAWARRLKAQGAPEAEARRRGRELEATFERLHPGEALVARLDAAVGAVDGATGPEEPGLARLRRVRRYLASRPADLRGVGLALEGPGDEGGEPGRADLLSLQRLARVAPFAEAVALLSQGHSSARSIAAAPRAAFARRLAQDLEARGLFGDGAAWDRAGAERQAEAIHRRAARQTGAALALAAALAPALRAAAPAAAGGPLAPAIGDQAATFERLFGPPDACSVAPCESVLGLPAYFVDLLERLEDAAEAGAPQPLAILRRRRPDLFAIELSCANAETPLPYLDLVIELLEEAVAGGPPRWRPPAWRPARLPASPSCRCGRRSPGAGARPATRPRRRRPGRLRPAGRPPGRPRSCWPSPSTWTRRPMTGSTRPPPSSRGRCPSAWPTPRPRPTSAPSG